MKSRYKRRYIPKARPQENRDHLYEYYKMMWQAAHPGASNDEYEAAIQKIARDLKL